MSERKRQQVAGIEVFREGSTWSWCAVSLDWQWRNLGSGGAARPNSPGPMAADAGHWCETIGEAVVYSIGYGEGFAAAGLKPGSRLTVPINARPAGSPPPPPPPPPPPEPPTALPVDGPKGGKP